MTDTRFRPTAALRLPMLFAMLLLCACAQNMPRSEAPEPSSGSLKPELVTRAIQQASALKAAGKRVWCVPFARDASGVEIRGNAGTWWDSAKDLYARGHTPQVGAVMAFRATGKLPMGHVAVVSKILSEREILIDHANWKRSQISMGMSVIDVSKNNDWTAVRVKSQPDSYGRIYPVNGFIFPEKTAG